jgi:hypothetical protein
MGLGWIVRFFLNVASDFCEGARISASVKIPVFYHGVGTRGASCTDLKRSMKLFSTEFDYSPPGRD